MAIAAAGAKVFLLRIANRKSCCSAALIFEVNQGVLETNQGRLKVGQMWPSGVAAQLVQKLHRALHLTNGPGDVVAVPVT